MIGRVKAAYSWLCAMPMGKDGPNLSPAGKGFSPWLGLSLTGWVRWGGYWDGPQAALSQHSALSHHGQVQGQS